MVSLAGLGILLGLFGSYILFFSRTLFPKSTFAREGASQFDPLTATLGEKCFSFIVLYICLSVCRFVQGNLNVPLICTLFVLSLFLKNPFIFNILCVLICFGHV